ncbi:MAG: hypothetical protein EXS36_11535 [Pedosphaera sp.]|nr:hypothetical protein [Pedosphaera sp.]
MNFAFARRLAGMILFFLMSWFAAARSDDARFIRLRNETITTPPADHARARLQSAVPEAAVSGLFLLQFTDRMQPEWRDALRTRGVDLLRFVPDDAFVVEVVSNRLGELRSLPFVRWIGLYEPRHKLHSRLMRQLATNALGNPIEVKILANPRAGVAGLSLLSRAFEPGARHHLNATFGAVITGRILPARLLNLARSPLVLWVELAPRMKLVDEVATLIVAGEGSGAPRHPRVHELGFDGSGVTVSIADSGIDLGEPDGLHPDLAGRVDAFIAYGGLPDAGDEHSHGTHCAGIVAGNGATGERDDDGNLWGLGVAPGAHLIAQRIFDAAGGYFPPPTYETLTRDAVRNGAYIGSNSWGDDTQGQYDISASEFDALVRDADALTPGEQQYVLEFSAGNAGPGGQTIGSPAVAKNVIATGAVENNRFGFGIYDSGQEVMADFSSRGPCEDGRIKPDITAPGTWIASVKSQLAGEENAWSPINANYLYQGGTSQAGPHASGAAAVLVQWYRQTHAGANPSPALVKAGLINSADDMGTSVIPDGEEDGGDGGIVVGDTAPVPNSDEGWGRINLENLIDPAGVRFDFTDQGIGLATGKITEKRIIVGPEEALKVTLVYTDVPGLPAAIPALVNDLDLEVVSPEGNLYRGNAFVGGEAVAGTPEGDRINNVEAVHISAPQAGEWIVRIRAHNVVQDVHHRTNGAPEQDFALVISGRLPLPGEGVISWGREAYRAPANATIRLVDSQLAGQSTVTVTVKSTTESAGFLLTLARSSAGGSFTGSVALAIGPANAVDAVLQVHDKDELTVTYVDASPAGERVAIALIDSTPPVVAGVATLGEFGHVAVQWTTDELADSFVYFGITNAVTNLVSDLGFRAQHRLGLPELDAGTNYYYFIVSSDKAGNVTTNTIEGRYYRFVGPKVAAALLVYSPESTFGPDGLLSETPYPGIESWTGPLNSIGLEYDVWDTGRGSVPSSNDLRPYRLVLWRPEELVKPAPGLVTALGAYVRQGGALFVSSFDLLTRLKDLNETNFPSEILHLADFDEDQGANHVKGLAGDPVGGGIDLDLNYDAFPSGFIIDLLDIRWPEGPDHLRIGTNGAAIFQQENGRPVGVRYPRTGQDSKGRVVFYSFALESVPTENAPPNNRLTVLGNALNFLVPSLRDSSGIAFDQGAYTLPSSVVVEVTDSRRSGSGSVVATLSAGGRPPRSANLVETVQKGVFRTRLTLSGTGGTPDPLIGASGETILASYVDAVSRATSATALIDTLRPKISGVESDPAYNEVTVVWNTDKETDATVRFGESGGDDSFLTRSAYSGELATSHEVTLLGLLPNRDYYFQVVSRDAAGNTTTDNNAGKLYSVRTLKPILPPWLDTLEAGRVGWVIIENSSAQGGDFGGGDGEDDGFGGSSVGWQFGTPKNNHQVEAHSGTNCWATNLRGEGVDYALTDLISPAVSLIGGNKATLRFWHNYDFQDVGTGGDDDGGFGDIHIEGAQIALSTDNGGTWNDIYSNQDETSSGWEEIRVDISKYVGQVVRFRFNYQMFSFNTTDRLGWLIDDVGVEMNAVAETVIRVTNNLAGARFVIKGSNNVAGEGREFRTNVTAGPYVIVWSPVPYYVTPPPQTNVLTTNGPLLFVGTYAFPDSNQNGISDLWEQQYFGKVDAVHPATTDTDGDGASDLGEFLAGTDPSERTSVLRIIGPLVQPNRTVHFEWMGVVGHEYRLEISNDLEHWVTGSDAIRGRGDTAVVSLPTLDVRLVYYFRLRVTP